MPLPIIQRDGEDEQEFMDRAKNNLLEERRLAYVGVSRARKYLTITFLLGCVDVKGSSECWLPSMCVRTL